MIERIEGIVVDIRRHNDRHDVAGIFTRSHGRVGFIIPARSKRNSRTAATIRHLARIEAIVDFRPNRELQNISDLSPEYIYTDIYFSPMKSAVAIFIADFLNRLLRDSAADISFYDYIADSLLVLDSAGTKTAADFHIVFLLSILPFAGIQPDLTDAGTGAFFDMRAGNFTKEKPLHNDFLTPDEASAIPALMRISYVNSRLFRLNRETRNRILDILIRYYSIHFPGISQISDSLDILRELF